MHSFKLLSFASSWGCCCCCLLKYTAMDPEKGRNSVDLADKSDNVVTKTSSAGEAQDAIVYPNVFWTSCVSFGVALGLFLVTHRRVPWSISADDANKTISGRPGHGKRANTFSFICIGSLLGLRLRSICLISSPDRSSRQSSRPLSQRLPRNSRVLTSSAGTRQLFSSPWLALSRSGMVLLFPLI